jgi:sn-glycerol 3-phosphate transport system substrate-binding protein
MNPRVVTALAATAALALAACGSGRSILEAGNDPTPAPPTVAPVTTIAGQTTLPGQTTVPQTVPPTEPPPTTDASKLEDYPPCPVHALDATTGVTNITFWYALNSTNATALQQVTDAYNAGQTKVHVSLENQNGYAEMIDKYTQSSQDARPNVAQLPEYALQLAIDSDSIIPAQACVEAAGFDTSVFVPRALGAYTTQGLQWGTPFNISSPVLFYRKSMFEQAGLDPEDPPATIDELRQASQAIVDSGAAPVGLALESGVDSGGGWFLEQWLAKQGQFYADNENGRAAPASRVLYNTPQTVELLTAVQSLVTDGLAVYLGDNPGGQDQLFKLADRSAPAAMAIVSSASLGPVLSLLDGGMIAGVDGSDVGVGPMPGPGSPGALIGGAALYVVAGKSDAETAATWDFLEYLVSAQTQSTWAAATGYAPVVTAATTVEPLASTYANDPRFAVSFDQLTVAVDAPSSLGPVLGPMREVRIVAQQLTDTVLSGGDVAAAVAAAAAQADAIIADYARNN